MRDRANQLMRRVLEGAAVAVVIFGAGSVLAQQAVDTQTNKQGQQQPAPGQRVDPELYGNNTSPTVAHYQTVVLPSEAKIAIQQSGATPSELRTQADRVGPLAPNGLASYIPVQSALQRAIGLPVPVLFNPAYGYAFTYDNPFSRGPLPAPVPTSLLPSPPVPSRSEEPNSPLYIRPQRVNAAVPLNAGLTPTATEGTVYYRLPVRAPATQPTTQPTRAPSPGERP